MSKIIGINYASHDSSVTYIEDGVIKFSMEEEKFTGIKSINNHFAHPTKGLEYIEKKYGVNIYNCDIVAFSLPYMRQFIKTHGLHIADKTVSYSHHDCHALGSYFTSGMDGKVISLSHDGKGYRSRGKLFLCDNGLYEEIHSQHIPVTASLAGLWAASTTYLGWRMLKDEGKVVGLAAHGKLNQRIYDLFKMCMYYDGNLNFKPSNWESLLHHTFHSYLSEEGIFANKESREDYAFTLQKFSEDLMYEYLKDIHLKYPEYRKLCLSGGLFANVKLNQFINNLDFFDEIYIHPSMGDGGLSLGAAVIAANEINEIKKPVKFENVFFGDSFTKEDWDSELLQYSNELKIVPMTYQTAASLINDGYVLGCFFGRTEYGPRALGNRSIVVRPTDVETHERLNKKLRRTEIMPFAPSIISEKFSEVFKEQKSLHTAEFMTLCYDTNHEWLNKIPAVVHDKDKTARPQRVIKENNPHFHRLISEYYNISGMPVVLNTSFNAHGEPINNYPSQVIKHLMDDSIDYLVNEFYIISKNGRDLS